MSTDGVSLSEAAVDALRTAVVHEYGQEYVPPQPRAFKARSKNAQVCRSDTQSWVTSTARTCARVTCIKIVLASSLSHAFATLLSQLSMVGCWRPLADPVDEKSTTAVPAGSA
jgi:hypothetical protein